MKQPVLPLEGDLLFEEKPINKLFLFFILLLGVFFLQAAISSALDFIRKPEILLGLTTLIFLAPGVFFVYFISIFIKEFSRKYGLYEETFKGYYFKDKIIFYRISKYVDEIYTQGLSKEQIEVKIKETKVDIESMEKLLADSGEVDSFDIWLKITLMNLEKGLNLIENGLAKPHKYEVLFSDIKYFINENNQIKLVNKTDDDENSLNGFHNKLTLSEKYKKHQAAIVEFLNQRVAESTVFHDGDNVN